MGTTPITKDQCEFAIKAVDGLPLIQAMLRHIGVEKIMIDADGINYYTPEPRDLTQHVATQLMRVRAVALAYGVERWIISVRLGASELTFRDNEPERVIH